MSLDCSIVIPIYNAEKTLLRTISSVREITDTEIEIILIDDGSIDNSLDICKQQAALDNRIRIYTQNNSGVSAARNLGIENAKGKYLYFLDADDKIVPTAIKSIIFAMDYYKLDLSISNYKEHYESTNKEIDISVKLPYNQLLNRQFITTEIYKRLYLGDNIIGLSNVWNKIFRNEIIKRNGIKFEENRTHGEDWKFVIDYLAYVNTLMIFPEILQIYYLNGSQVIHKYRKGLLHSVINSLSIKEHLLKTGSFKLTKESETLVALTQFIDLLHFLKLNPTRNELKSIRCNSEIKALSKKILALSPSSLRDAKMSRNLYLIAFCLWIGLVSLSIKLINRGF